MFLCSLQPIDVEFLENREHFLAIENGEVCDTRCKFTLRTAFLSRAALLWSSFVVPSGFIMAVVRVPYRAANSGLFCKTSSSTGGSIMELYVFL